MTVESKEILCFLRSIESLYPGGVPLVAIREVSQTARQMDPVLGFIGSADKNIEGTSFSGALGELLRSAATKGLGLNLDSVEFLNVATILEAPEQGQDLFQNNPSLAPGILTAVLDRIKAPLVVILGVELAHCIIGDNQSFARGTWIKLHNKNILITIDPIQVLKDPQLKRTFWDDLKTVLQKCSNF